MSLDDDVPSLFPGPTVAVIKPETASAHPAPARRTTKRSTAGEPTEPSAELVRRRRARAVPSETVAGKLSSTQTQARQRVSRTDRPPNKKSASTKKPRQAASRREFPASTFADVLVLAQALQDHAGGDKAKRLTILKHLEKSPNSSVTRALISEASRYGLIAGNHSGEWLELTPDGHAATSSDAVVARAAQFKLSIDGIGPFKALYDRYKSRKLPSHDVLKDVLAEWGLEESRLQECVDAFIVNAKSLGLLDTVAGAETLIPFEHLIARNQSHSIRENTPSTEAKTASTKRTSDWSKICFYISPIGQDGSESRKHSDMFLNTLIEPVLKEFGMQAVRADKIGPAGAITSQIIEHIVRARLVIMDMSFLNPNAFYEMCLRHAVNLPIVQICRKADTLPFDVNQVRTVFIDTTDLHSFVPHIETYRSQIATQVRAALNDGSFGNPIALFFPGLQVTIPPGPPRSAELSSEADPR